MRHAAALFPCAVTASAVSKLAPSPNRQGSGSAGSSCGDSTGRRDRCGSRAAEASATDEFAAGRGGLVGPGRDLVSLAR